MEDTKKLIEELAASAARTNAVMQTFVKESKRLDDEFKQHLRELDKKRQETDTALAELAKLK